MPHDVVNTEQAEAWNGAEGAHWAQEWKRFDDSIASHHQALMRGAAIQDGERVLDVGCGNGLTSRDAGRATPSGSVLGVDLSEPMLEQARQQAAAEGLTNVEFMQGDAQVHPFEAGAFDVAISRFCAMFFADKVAAFTNIASALRPGGRLALVVWQALSENEQFQTITGSLAAGREMPKPPPDAPSPFGLADVELGRGWLESAGFVDVEHSDVRGPFYLGADADDAVAFAENTHTSRQMLQDLDEATKERALATLRAAFEAHATPEGVTFNSASWLITARKP